MNTVLSAQEVAHYHEHGYVIPDYRVPETLLTQLQRAVDVLLTDYTDVAPEDLANPHMMPSDSESEPSAFMAVARQPEMLDLVEQIIGPDIILWIIRVLCKPAYHGREVPWHQDGEYWPIRPLATCSVWLAIDPATPDNGCMRFIPGSHRREALYRHHTAQRGNLVLDLELDDDQFDASQAVDVVLEPGQISLHDVRMIHGSLANTSTQRRAALIMRYMPASSHYQRALVRQRHLNSSFDIYHQPLWLMRGTDRCGKNDFVHGHEIWAQRYSSSYNSV